MQPGYVDIPTISDLHRLYGQIKPKHPLISVIDLKEVDRSTIDPGNTGYRPGFYAIYYKPFKGSMKYGRSIYDFDEGTLMFTAPNQVISINAKLPVDEGWGLCFHPDLLHRTPLGSRIKNYSFFQYSSNEALHISGDEKAILDTCIENIRKEYSQNIDKHTQTLIVSTIELLLNYCVRFYDRQFLTRAKPSQDIVQQFEQLLLDYFEKEPLIELGLPDVKYFAAKLNLSPNYLSDLLNRYTGKTTREHIHLQLVEKAKTLLWSSQKSISEIAYELGFSHPSHFTKIFKTKTGKSPLTFRGS